MPMEKPSEGSSQAATGSPGMKQRPPSSGLLPAMASPPISEICDIKLEDDDCLEEKLIWHFIRLLDGLASPLEQLPDLNPPIPLNTEKSTEIDAVHGWNGRRNKGWRRV